MKAFIRRSFEIICYIGYFATILMSILAALSEAQNMARTDQMPVEVAQAILFFLGLTGGFVLATLLFGTLLILVEIAENTKETRRLIEQRTS